MQNNPITIEVLQTLDAIDRRGSFAKAAEELNKATSAVSYAVQKLEEQMDITLFQRQGRRSVLTPAGQLLLKEGREILKYTARLSDRVKEVATGWEPRIRIAVESLQSYPTFFKVLETFLQQHSSIEIDVSESVLNGGWDALQHDRVDLLVGSPGPVPPNKGYRAIAMTKKQSDLVAVVASHHQIAKLAATPAALLAALPQVRRVITHDTSVVNVAKSAGFNSGGQNFYVQNIDQKRAAIVAGIGIGHLPRHRIEEELRSGILTPLNLQEKSTQGSFIVWKIDHKGKGLAALTRLMAAAFT